MFLLICPSERNINCLLSRASPPLPLPPRRSRDRNRLRGAGAVPRLAPGVRRCRCGAGPAALAGDGVGGRGSRLPGGARKEATSQPRTRVLSPPRGHFFLHPRDPRVVRLSSKALEHGACVEVRRMQTAGCRRAGGGAPETRRAPPRAPAPQFASRYLFPLHGFTLRVRQS